MELMAWNQTDTSDLKCGECDSWLEHWCKRASSKTDGLVCSHVDCDKAATLGGHVLAKHVGGPLKSYIVPLCDTHNQTTLPNLNLRRSTVFVDSTRCKPI